MGYDRRDSRRDDRRDDRRDERPKPPPDRPDLGNREQVRRLNKAMERSAKEVVRCQKCGAQQSAEAAFIGPLTTCDKCATPLHSCCHCVHFDSGARFQCRKPVPAGQGDKWAGNSCEFYQPRLVLDATGKRLYGQGTTNAKTIFDSLFKK